MDWILAIALCIISSFIGLVIGHFTNRNKNIHKTPCESFNLFKGEMEGFKSGILEKMTLQNKKVEEMEKRLDAGDERFNSIEKANIKLEGKIDRIKEMLEIILTSVKSFSSFQEQISKLTANKNA
jgi:hypothetical protein